MMFLVKARGGVSRRQRMKTHKIAGLMDVEMRKTKGAPSEKVRMTGTKAIKNLYKEIQGKMQDAKAMQTVDIERLQPFKAFKWLLDESEVEESKNWIAKICDVNAASSGSSSETAIGTGSSSTFPSREGRRRDMRRRCPTRVRAGPHARGVVWSG